MKNESVTIPRRFRVTVIEHDSWSGSEVLEVKEFDDYDEAKEYADSEDTRKASGPVPDYYIRAELKEI